MVSPRILKLIRACDECPHKRYDSGGQNDCDLTGQRVPSSLTGIAGFCPLPNYPGKIIADQEHSLKMLREAYSFNFMTTLMAHVSIKLDVNLDSRSGGILFETADNEWIRLHPECIIMLEWRPLEITFVDSSTGCTYKLQPDAHRPRLYKEVTVADIKGWVELTL